MPDPENTIPTVATTQVPAITETPKVTLEATPPEHIRNPDGLLKAFEAQKAELAQLKEFKINREKELALIEQDRLKKEQQFEALVPLKIEEATKPLSEKLSLLESSKVTLEKQLAESNAKYEALLGSQKVSSDKDALYSEFISQKGDPATSKDALWKLYGSDIKQDKDGKLIELPELIKMIQADTFGSKLFTNTSPVGSGTTPQKSTVAKEATDSPRVVTQAMLLNPKKHGIKMDDISSGKIIVKD